MRTSENADIENNKTTVLSLKLQNLLPWSALIAIYQVFLGPRYDHCDITYNETCYVSFHHKPGSFQYSACLAITGAIIGTYKRKVVRRFRFEASPASVLLQKTMLL